MKKAILIPSILLASCSGTMQGMVAGTSEAISFKYNDSGFDKGKLTATTKNGKIFSGNYINLNNEVSSVGFINDTNLNFLTAIQGSSEYKGIVKAVLIGNKGNNMKCEFQVASPSMGILSGGNGVCKISDGRVVDVYF